MDANTHETWGIGRPATPGEASSAASRSRGLGHWLARTRRGAARMMLRATGNHGSRNRGPRNGATAGGAFAHRMRTLGNSRALRVFVVALVLLGGVSGTALHMLAANGAPVRSAPHPTGAPAAKATAARLLHAKFTLDNVTIAIESPFLPAAKFTVAKPGAAAQIATALSHRPFEEFSVTAIPAAEPGSRELALAGVPGGPDAYLAALRGAQSPAGPTANLFGKRVTGRSWLVMLKVDGTHASPTLVVEWDTSAGHRNWTVRITRAEPAGTTRLAVASALLQSLSTLSITSASLTRPTTVVGKAPVPRNPGRSAVKTPRPARTPPDNAQLSVPYLSQYFGQPDQNCDCGPASVGMAVQYYGHRPGNLSDASYLIQVRNATGNTNACTSPNFPADTDFPELESALAYYGISYSEIPSSLTPQPTAQIQAMEQATSAGQPVIALVSGADLGRGSNYGAHWLVVTGFSSDGQTVYINDPDNQSAKLPGWIVGGQIALSVSTFSQAAYDAPAGPYGIIVGTGGGGGGGGSLNPPTLQSPSNGATLNNRTVTFSWAAPNMSNINGYTLHVSTTSTIDGSGANLIVDQGVGPTSYTYTFSQDYTTLWWGVATWNTSNQRSNFSAAWTFGINTTPADTTPPSEAFTSPTTDTLTAPCYYGAGYAGSVNLAVDASDNVAMSYVTFFRYDGASSSWVALTTLNGSGPSYQMTLDCGTLPLGWNEIDAMAVDTSNNYTNQWIGLDAETPPAPPSNLSGQAPSCGQASLSWTDNSSNEDGFNIYRDGSYLDQVGTDVTTYQDYAVSAGTSYSYTVTAYSGAVESTPSNATVVDVPPCPPDTTPPSESFTSPTTNGSSAPCYTGGGNAGSVLLAVDATDNVAVAYVTFFRWDNASANWIALSTPTAPPYQFTLDCATLQLGANDIDAMAVDTSNNFTNQSINLDYEVDPPNDALASATPMYSPWYEAQENTSAATIGGTDLSSGCGVGVNSNSVWFVFAPSRGTPVYVSTAGSSYDTVLAVWASTGPTATLVTCDDDAYGAVTSWVSYFAQPGYTYYVEVMSYDTTSGGALQLTTSPTRMPLD